MSTFANRRRTKSTTISKANGISMPGSNAPLTLAGRPPGSTSLMRTLGNRGKIASAQAFKNLSPPSRWGVLDSLWPMKPVAWPGITLIGILSWTLPPSWARSLPILKASMTRASIMIVSYTYCLSSFDSSYIP